MNNLNETESLNIAIVLLQDKRKRELELLKEQFHDTYESLRPINLIKNAFNEVSSPNVQGSLVDNAIGLGTGYLSKKIVVGRSRNPLRKLMGTLLQFAITNVVSKNADGIKSTGIHLAQSFLKHRKKQKQQANSNSNSKTTTVIY